MNPAESSQHMPRPHDNETLLRRALLNMSKEQRQAVMRAAGWDDDSSVSKVLTGNAGIKLDQLDAILAIFGLTVAEVDYMNYLAKGNTIGANCCRTRASRGQCGPRG
jgi:hypothetical protein